MKYQLMKMTKFFNIFLTTLSISLMMMFISCSSEILDDNDLSNPDKEFDKSNYVIMPVLKTEASQELSRSSLYYNYATGGTSFSWYLDTDKTDGQDNSDQIGVYAVTPTANSDQQKYAIEELANGGTTGIFGKTDNGFITFGKESYVSFFPFQQSEEFTYENIPVTYLDQTQLSNPKIYYYRYRVTRPYDDDKTNKTEQDYINLYQKSEQEACTHLAQMDYLVSGPTQPSASQNIHFKMKRLSAIIRFFVVIPEKGIYDKIQVYNPNTDKPFVTQTTMDAKQQKFSDTPTKTTSSIYLKLGNSGIDFTDSNTDLKYYKYSDKYPNLLVAYMMAAPLDLSGADDKQCTLYLHRDSGSPENHKVYKATLAKKELKQDYLNQWTVASSTPDEPITFTNITVQQWQQETGYDNTDKGNGTSSW